MQHRFHQKQMGWWVRCCIDSDGLASVSSPSPSPSRCQYQGLPVSLPDTGGCVVPRRWSSQWLNHRKNAPHASSLRMLPWCNDSNSYKCFWWCKMISFYSTIMHFLIRREKIRRVDWVPWERAVLNGFLAVLAPTVAIIKVINLALCHERKSRLLRPLLVLLFRLQPGFIPNSTQTHN